MEKSKRSKATLTVRMKHGDDYGMNGPAREFLVEIHTAKMVL